MRTPPDLPSRFPFGSRPSHSLIISHLAVLLFSAERAWAHAQERKAALGSTTATGAARKALVARAVRAERWGADLARLTGGAVPATPRTAVEAAAYAAWLAGLASLERGSDWAGALASLARAQVLTRDLAAGGGPARLDARAAASAQMVDLEPSLRFAQYQLGLSSGGGSAAGAAAAEAALAKAGAAVAAEPCLKAALEAVAAEGGGGEEENGDATAAKAGMPSSSSTGFATFEWRGGSHFVASERVRSALVAAHKAGAAPAASAPSSSSRDTSAAGTRIAALDSTIAALGRAKAAARAAWVSASSSGSGSAAADARALALALTGAQLERSLERGKLLVAGLTARLDAGLAAAAAASVGGSGQEKGGASASTSTVPPLRRARPEELMRAYDAVTKASKSLGEVAAALGGSVGEVLLDEAAAAGAGAAAGRAYAAGHAFLAARKPAEAMALFGRAGERVEAAIDAHAECARPDAAAVAGLEALAASARLWRGVAHAQAAAAEAASLTAVTGRVGGLELASGDGGSGDGGASTTTSAPPPVYLTDGPAALASWTSFAPPGSAQPPRLAPLPPRLQAVPVRPFVLDLAFDGIVAPDLSHRLPAGGGGGGGKVGGVVGRLFGWGG